MSRHPIPDAALDDRLFFGGTAGSGKTYNAGSRVERLLARKNRVVIPDPLGVWWGLRLDATGKKPSGYDVVIFGGPHGDLPLTEHAGALIGETVAGMKESVILDLSQLGTKAAERRFMLAFLTALYRHTPGEPLHVIFDEADMWAPQKLLDKEGDAAKLLGMMETIVRRGRVKGFIPWLISQRPAVLSKDVLSQADGIIAFKLTSSQDRDAIGGWVEGQADKKTWAEIWANLPTMERGQGLVWVPARGVLHTVQFPEKETFDSSRTPKRGEKLKRTADLKPIDLGAVKDRLATVEAEAKANDPKALRADVAKLRAERDALAGQVEKASKTSNPEALKAASDQGFARGEKAVKSAAEKKIRELTAALEQAMKVFVEINAKGFFKAGGEAIDKKEVEKIIAGATDHIGKLVERHLAAREKEMATLKAEAQRVLARLKTLSESDVSIKVDVKHNEPFTIAPTPTVRDFRAPAASGPLTVTEGLTPAKQKILDAIAWVASLGTPVVPRDTIAFMADTTPNSSAYANNLGALRSAGLIDYPAQNMLALTDQGTASANQPESAPTHEAIMGKIGAKLMPAQMRIISALASVYPNDLSKEDLAEAAGTSATSSAFANNLGRLRTFGLLTYPANGRVRADDRLFPLGRAA